MLHVFAWLNMAFFGQSCAQARGFFEARDWFEKHFVIIFADRHVGFETFLLQFFVFLFVFADRHMGFKGF